MTRGTQLSAEEPTQVRALYQARTPLVKSLPNFFDSDALSPTVGYGWNSAPRRPPVLSEEDVRQIQPLLSNSTASIS